MKRIVFLTIITLGLSGINTMMAQRALKNGFSIKLITGIPDEKFGMEKNDDPGEMKYGSLWGFELGNRWYFSPTDQIGFGLMINWTDASIAVKSEENLSRITLDLALIELGPIFTYAFTENLALDAYYNFRPTIMYSAFNIGDLTFGANGFGITHAIGGGIRYSVFSFGMEYVTGTIKDARMFSSSDLDIDLGKTDMVANSFRFLIGFKF